MSTILRLVMRMSVEENLEMGCYRGEARRARTTTLGRVYRLFPILRERRRQLAGSLSGGQQQMVAIGRALMAQPRLALLDEPSLGLAPAVVDHMFEIIRAINGEGVAILLVEQNVVRALEIAARAHVLEEGRVVAHGPRRFFASNRASERRILVCATPPTSTREGGTTMAVIKVRDLAYGRLRAPDLDVMEEFLTHFGLIRSARTPTALYMRGTDPRHHLHVTEKGDPAFVGFAYAAASEEDLARVAKAPGASAVESIDEPGGGKRVRLREPNGYQIEVVHGIGTPPAIPVARQPMNTGPEPLRRAGELMRLKKSPAPIKRIGHGVFGTPKVRETVQWFRDTLGFIGSDDVYVGDKDNIIGSFNRCDCGDEFVDHHTMFAVNNERAGMNHMSFEVPDVDAVFMDHEYLARLGKYEHMWGVGRHLLGSQVYDYWCDPWGRVHERWADTDRLNAKSGSNLLPAHEAFISQWGEDPPEKFLRHVSV